MTSDQIYAELFVQLMLIYVADRSAIFCFIQRALKQRVYFQLAKGCMHAQCFAQRAHFSPLFSLRQEFSTALAGHLLPERWSDKL